MQRAIFCHASVLASSITSTAEARLTSQEKCDSQKLIATVMRRTILAMTLALSAVLFANQASAATYRFSFGNVLGTVAGTIEGEIDLDFITSPTDSGTGPASRIEITSTPAAIPASDEGDIATSWMTQAANTFTVVNGVITDYQFGASEGAVPACTDNVLCLNNGGFFSVGGVYICGPGENYLGGCFDYVYNVDAIAGVDFQLVSAQDVTRATAWRNASKKGRVRYEGVVSGLDFSSGLTFTVTDGGSLDQSGSVTAGDCAPGRNGRVLCVYRDPSIKKKVVRASFRPTGNAGEYRYHISMNKLDVLAPQAGPLNLTIDDGTTSYEGSATNCTEQRKKLVCG